jgi:hypothetical protein
MNFTPLKNNKNQDPITVDDIRMARITITFPVYRTDTRETCIDVARDCLYNYDEEGVSVEVATPTLEELESFSKQYGDHFISNGVDDLTLNEIIRKSKTSSDSKNKKKRKNKV